jgi:hypothetical protein
VFDRINQKVYIELASWQVGESERLSLTGKAFAITANCLVLSHTEKLCTCVAGLKDT